MMNKKKKGFTLIELIVVIAILGILASIAVPRVLGFQNRARAQADKQTAVQIRNALALLHSNGELVFTDGGTYSVATGAAGTTTVTGITPVPAAGNVETLVEAMTNNITVQGTTNILVTVQADGQVAVTTP